MLDSDPEAAAPRLAALGDPRSIEDLSRAVDRLLSNPIGDCEICHGLHLDALRSAVHALGGTLRAEQEAAIAQVHERASALWIPFGESGTFISRASHELPAPRVPAARPGRNDPCPCGSGLKYKRCHLEADAREDRLH
jgi:hypothetical protein